MRVNIRYALNTPNHPLVISWFLLKTCESQGQGGGVGGEASTMPYTSPIYLKFYIINGTYCTLKHLIYTTSLDLWRYKIRHLCPCTCLLTVN